MSPRAASPRPGDHTAIEAQKLEREHQQEQAQRAQELAMVAQAEQEAERQGEVVDYFEGASRPLAEPEFPADQDEAERSWVVRMLMGVEQMTFGREIRREAQYDDEGNMTAPPELGGIRYFDFEEGRRYRLPREMAEHLITKGLAVRDRVAP
jgi:hypothetical protein